MIELENITVVLGSRTVLDNVCLSVPSASFTSVLGESGAGKTTLLNVLCGLLPQNSGRVLFDGVCVDDTPAHKRDVSVVFQDSRLFPNMSVLDNVAFPLKMRGVGRADRRDQAKTWLARVKLEDLGDRRTNELSGGQRQRVALARALAAEPFAVLLDEPFSGLDESLRDDMRQLVVSLHEESGTTMLMVTHDVREALLMSDKVAYVANGRIQQEGPSADVLMQAATLQVAASFGSALAVEGRTEKGVFTSGKLVVPASHVPDGPAVLLRTADGAITVHPRI